MFLGFRVLVYFILIQTDNIVFVRHVAEPSDEGVHNGAYQVVMFQERRDSHFFHYGLHIPQIWYHVLQFHERQFAILHPVEILIFLILAQLDETYVFQSVHGGLEPFLRLVPGRNSLHG